MPLPDFDTLAPVENSLPDLATVTPTSEVPDFESLKEFKPAPISTPPDTIPLPAAAPIAPKTVQELGAMTDIPLQVAATKQAEATPKVAQPLNTAGGKSQVLGGAPDIKELAGQIVQGVKEFPSQVMAGADFAANVSKGLVLDLGASLLDENKGGQVDNSMSGNIGAYFNNEPLPAEEAIKSVAKTNPIAVTLAKISTGIAGIIPSIPIFDALPAIAKRVIGAGFALYASTQVPKVVSALGDEYGKNPDERDPNTMTDLWASLITNTGFAALAGYGTGKGIAKDVPALKNYLTKTVVQNYPPEMLNSIFVRVASDDADIKAAKDNNRATKPPQATPEERNLHDLITTYAPKVASAIREGVSIEDTGARYNSDFLNKYLGVDTTPKRTLVVKSEVAAPPAPPARALSLPPPQPPEPPIENPTVVQTIQINHPVYGQGELPVIQEYKGEVIAKASNDRIAVVSKDGRTVFFPALNDGASPHKWVDSENTVDGAKKYIDWLKGVQKPVAETPASAVEPPKQPTPFTIPDFEKNTIETLLPDLQAKLKHGDGIRYGLSLGADDVPRLQSKYDELGKQMRAAAASGDEGLFKSTFGKLNFYGGALMGATRGEHPISGSNYERFIKANPDAVPTPPETAKTPAITGNGNQPVAAGGVNAEIKIGQKPKRIDATPGWQVTRQNFVQRRVNETQNNTPSFVNSFELSHAHQVKQAMEDGLPVTPEVLKDFPDLQKLTTPVKPTSVQPSENFSRISKRYSELMPSAQQSVITKNSDALFHAIDTGTYGDIVHPSNKNSRQIFEEMTGKKLASTLTGTKANFKGQPMWKTGEVATPPLDEILTGTPTVVADDGQIIKGQDHGDAKRRAEESGHAVSGFLGERSGWLYKGKNYLAKDVETGAKVEKPTTAIKPKEVATPSFPQELWNYPELNARIEKVTPPAKTDTGYRSDKYWKLETNLQVSVGERAKYAEILFDSIPTRQEVADAIREEQKTKGIQSESNQTPPEKPKTEVKSPIANLSDAEKAEFDALKAELFKKLGGQTNLPLLPDPEVITLVSKLAGLYAKGGIKTFDQFAKHVKDDLPSMWDKIKAYLRVAWNHIAEFFGLDEVSRADADKIFSELDKVVAEEAPAVPAVSNLDTEIVALINSDATPAQKSFSMRRMAAENGISTKAMQEKVEAHVVRLADEIVRHPNLSNDHERFEHLQRLYNKQPRFTARTSTSVGDQAYSTPVPLAFALNHAIRSAAKASYEPTAGNGALMIGDDLANSHANEKNKERANELTQNHVGTVTMNDATTFTPKEKFEIVKTNPPFGSTDNQNIGGYGIKRLEHLISIKALDAMADDGRGYMILGAALHSSDTGAGAQRVFENYIYGHYNVVDNFEAAGDLYSNQGASFPVRILVVDGRRATPIGGELSPKKVDRLTSWNDIWDRTQKIRDEIDQRRQSMVSGEPAAIPLRPQTPAATAENGGAITTPSGESPSKVGVGGKRGGKSGRGSAFGVKSPTGGNGQPAVGTVQRPENAERPAGDGSGTGLPTGGVEVGNEGGAENVSNAGSGGATGSGKSDAGIVRKPDTLKPAPKVKGTEFQVPYEPRSEANPFGTLIPKSIAGGVHDYLDELKTRVGNLDEFVAKEIEMPVEQLRSVMAAEQIDGVAMAIDQIKTDGAVIVGDQTGIGKGRQAAAIIRYALKNGIIPVFFTKDPKLFSDMYGDLADIYGLDNPRQLSTTVKPFILGDVGKATIVDTEGNIIHKAPSKKMQDSIIEKISSHGMDKSGYNAVFATYSQINNRNERQLFLERLTSDNPTIVIMDEAHEASGDAETSMQSAFFTGGTIKRGSGSDIKKIKVPGILNARGTKTSDGGGVMYLSATFAKRPENMPVYFRTSLQKAADSFKQIVSAMQKGGVALQQAVSEALAKAGQYIRRERQFEGVSYDMLKVTPHDENELIDHVDQVTDVLQQIVEFSQKVRDSMEGSTAMTGAQIDMTDFASVVHNQIGQLLLAAKADAVVEQAIKAHGLGEKPVIALMNTMESFLDHYAEDKGLKGGEAIQLRWNELLKHALSRTLRVSEEQPNGDFIVRQIDPSSLGEAGEALYRSIEETADGIESKFPVSPIDYIIQKLEKAGVKMSELTGRQSGIKYTDFENGKGNYVKFPPAKKNKVVNEFNNGTKDGMLLNASGSTGLSAHASSKFKDQRPRTMLIAQPAADINVFVQTLGRIFRTGLVMLGKGADGQPYGAKYLHLVLPLQAELRPAAMAARKMKSLNANTTAEADNAIKIESEDFFNRYGDSIVTDYLDQNQFLQDKLNMEVEHKDDGTPKVLPDIARKFTGRMMRMPDAWQKTAYQDIIPAYRQMIEQLKANGEYDLEIVTHDNWDGTRTSDEQLAAGTNENNIFTASVRMQQWDVSDKRHVPSGAEMEKEMQKNLGDRQKANKALDDLSTAAVDTLQKKIASYESQMAEAKSDAVKATLERNAGIIRAQLQRWENQTLPLISDIVKRTGDVITLTNAETGDSYDAMLVDIRYPKGNRLAPSAFQFKFFTDAPGGVQFITGSQLGGDKWNVDSSYKSVSDLKGGVREARYSRYVITGNPIKAYTATGGRGKMVRFLARDGKTITGLLMPRNWSAENLANDPRLDLINGKAVKYYLQKHTQQWNPEKVESGGSVSISRSRSGSSSFTVRTGAAKRAGGSIFLDPKLLKLTGDFTKVGNRMEATVDEDKIEKVADVLREITKSPFRPEGTPETLMPKVLESNNSAKRKGATQTAEELAAKLEDLKTGIGEGGQLHAFGILADLWDRAISVAQRIIRAGGQVADAIAAAIKYIRDNHKGKFDEAGVKVELEKTVSEETPKAPEPTEPPAPDEELPPRAQVGGIPEIGQRRPAEHYSEVRPLVREHGFDSTEPVTPENNDKAWQGFEAMVDPARRGATAQANLNKFGGADLSLGILQGEYRRYGLKLAMEGDPSLFLAVLNHSKDFITILEGGDTAAGRALNAAKDFSDDAMMEAVKEAMTKERDRAAAQGLKLKQSNYDFLRQVLDDLKMPVEEIEPIIEDALNEVTPEVPDEAADQLAMRKAARNKAAKGLMDEIKNAPLRTQNDPKWRLEVAERWFREAGLTDEQASRAADLFDKEFNTAFANASERVAREALKNADPKTTEDIIKAIRAGIMTPGSDWASQFAEKTGWKKPTDEQFKKLVELDAKLADDSLSPAEVAAVHSQMRSIAQQFGKGVDYTQAVAESFVGSMLSGLKTITVQAAPIIQNLRDLGIASVSDPKNARSFLRAMYNSARANIVSESKYAWQNDAYKFHLGELDLAHSQLDRIWQEADEAYKVGTPLQKAWARTRQLMVINRFVFKVLNTIDNTMMAGTREWKLAYYGSLAFKEAGITDTGISDLVDAMALVRQDAYDDAVSEGLDDLTAKVRANDAALMAGKDFISNRTGSASYGQMAWDAAERDAHSTTGRKAKGISEKDEGLTSNLLMNRFMEYNAATQKAGGAEAIVGRVIFGFVNIPYRTVRTASTFFPYGLFRSGIHEYRKKHNKENYWKQSFGNTLQAKARFREAIAGTIVTLIAIAWATHHNTSDDKAGTEDAALYITGAGPHNKTLADAWKKRGFRQNSLNFVFGGHVVAIPLTRVGEMIMFPFMIPAAQDDAAWKQKERAATGQPPLNPISLLTAQSIGTSLSMMGQKGIFQTIGNLTQSMQGGDSFVKAASKLGASVASATAIPMKQLLASLSDMFVGKLDQSSATALIAANFPIVGLPWQQKAINRFGDPIGDRSWYGRLADTGIPVAFQMSQTPANEKLYTTLVNKGVAPPELRRYIVEEKYGQLTDAQFHDFAVASGAALKQQATANVARLDSMTPEAAKKFLTSAATKADGQAASSLGLIRQVTSSGQLAGATSAPRPALRQISAPSHRGSALRPMRASLLKPKYAKLHRVPHKKLSAFRGRRHSLFGTIRKHSAYA